MLQEPDVFGYNDYRSYIDDWIEWKREATSERVGLRWVAKRANVGAGTLSNLRSKRHHASLEVLQRIARAMGIGADQIQYLLALAAFERAKRKQPRQQALARLFELRDRSRRPLTSADLSTLGTVLTALVLELRRRPDFVPDPQWVMSQCLMSWSEAEVRQAIAAAQALQGQESSMSTGSRAPGFSAYAYHQAAMALAGTALAEVPPDARHFGCVTAMVPPESLPELRRAADALCERVVALSEQVEGGGPVVQCNVQLFTIAASPE